MNPEEEVKSGDNPGNLGLPAIQPSNSLTLPPRQLEVITSVPVKFNINMSVYKTEKWKKNGVITSTRTSPIRWRRWNGREDEEEEEEASEMVNTN